MAVAAIRGKITCNVYLNFGGRSYCTIFVEEHLAVHNNFLAHKEIYVDIPDCFSADLLFKKDREDLVRIIDNEYVDRLTDYIPKRLVCFFYFFIIILQSIT